MNNGNLVTTQTNHSAPHTRQNGFEVKENPLVGKNIGNLFLWQANQALDHTGWNTGQQIHQNRTSYTY